MARVFIQADSMTTEELRRAIVAHRHARMEEAAPASLCGTSQHPVLEPHVGVNGPEHWSFLSQPLRPDQAAAVVAAMQTTTTEETPCN